MNVRPRQSHDSSCKLFVYPYLESLGHESYILYLRKPAGGAFELLELSLEVALLDEGVVLVLDEAAVLGLGRLQLLPAVVAALLGRATGCKET